MAPARERPPTFITPPPALSLCNQNNLGARKSEPGQVATYESAHSLLDHPLAPGCVVAVAGHDPLSGAGCHPGLGAPREDSSFMIRLLSVSTWIPRLWNMRAIRRLAGTLYCSFCGKSQHEVRKLIAGPTVFICDECVKLCMDITGEENKSSES